MTILCLQEATSLKYRAVAATLSESQPESGQNYSILLTGSPCTSASLSIESLLCQSAKLLQRLTTETNGRESLQTGNLSMFNESSQESLELSRSTSLLDPLDTNRNRSHNLLQLSLLPHKLSGSP